MGCGDSRKLSYNVQYCSLEPIQDKNNSFKIKLIAEEKILKVENAKLLEQIGKNNNSEIIQFIKRPNFEKNTLFYLFSGLDEPLIKTYSQSVNIVPNNSPLLSAIILLSTDLANNIPNQIIINATKNLELIDFVGLILNLNEKKKKLEKSVNPNLTKDSLSLKDESVIYDDDESIKEKKDEIIICDELKKSTYVRVLSKFGKNGGEENAKETNDNLETNEDKNCNINESNIKTVKFYGCKFDNLNIFYKIMNLLKSEKIRKFSFFENNINSDFEGWEIISDFLQKDYSLRYLDLHSSSLYDYHLNNIMGALIDKRIRYLNLSENFLTLEGVKIISDFLKENKTLQKLNLCRNAQSQFKSEAVKCIVESLIFNPNIKFLDCSYMILTGCGEFIGKFISTSKSIETIILRNVQLNAVDFKNIFVPLKTNKVLKEIDISLNDMGGDKSLQYIADAIKENKSLYTMKMDNINITNDNYQIIFSAIEQNKIINRYSLNYNSKIKPKILLSFFLTQKQVKHLEYEPYDKENPEDKNKELTLEERKIFEKFKTERPDMELVYK